MDLVVQRPTDTFVGPGATSLHILPKYHKSSHRRTVGVTDDTQIQKQSIFFNNTDRPERNVMIVAALVYFKYSALKDAESTEGSNELRNIMNKIVHTYLQYQTLKDAESTEGLSVLRNIMKQDLARLPPVPDTEGCKVHCELDRVAAHHECHWNGLSQLLTVPDISDHDFVWACQLQLHQDPAGGTWHQWSRFRLSLPTPTTSRSSKPGVSVLLFKRVNSRIHLQEIVFWSEWHATEQRNSWIHFSCFYRCEWLPVGQQVLIAPPARRARSFANTTDSFLLRSRPPRSSP